MTVRLGFEVGTGAAVDVPLAHTFVTGQTQLSGKTTTLRAIVERSGQRALAFITKRGESFEGRRIRPFLPREGDKQIPWRLVETVMAASLGQRNMKWERGAIVTASKGATTLQQVRDKVGRLQQQTKNPKIAELYMLLGEYLDLVLPEMAALNAATSLALAPGLNVMDLGGVGTQTQAMVIRAALEHINQHEKGVLTVFPEAWEFAPRGRSAPAKDEAIAMARKGAVLGNFLLCDSQDIAGVETTVRQAASVWILGVQRELNELKRTLQMIPAGIKKPKPEDVSTLELGQFFACWGRHAVKVYVQPAWMGDHNAECIAKGFIGPGDVKTRLDGQPVKEAIVNETEAQALRDENARLTRTNQEIQQANERLSRAVTDLTERLQALERTTRAVDAARGAADGGDRGHRTSGAGSEESRPEPRASRAAVQPAAEAAATPAIPFGPTFTNNGGLDTEALYQAIKTRLSAEASSDPVLLRVLLDRPELEVRVARRTITAEGDSLRGRIALLMQDGWFNDLRGATQTTNEMARRGWTHDYRNVERACRELAEMGFFRIEKGDRGAGFVFVPGMKVNVTELELAR